MFEGILLLELFTVPIFCFFFGLQRGNNSGSNTTSKGSYHLVGAYVQGT